MLNIPTAAEYRAIAKADYPVMDNPECYTFLCDFLQAVEEEHAEHPDKPYGHIAREILARLKAQR